MSRYSAGVENARELGPLTKRGPAALRGVRDRALPKASHPRSLDISLFYRNESCSLLEW